MRKVYGYESWTIKKGVCQRIDAFALWYWEESESPLDCKKIKSVNPKGNQSGISIGKTEAEAPILWLPDVNWPIGKDPDAGKGWMQEEKGATEDEMVGHHHWLDGCEFEQAPEVGDGQGSLECRSPRDRKELDMTEWLSWTELNTTVYSSYISIKKKDSLEQRESMLLLTGYAQTRKTHRELSLQNVIDPNSWFHM